MAEESLDAESLEAAERLVKFLDEHGFTVRAALWLYQSEADRWRFIIAFREKRQDYTTFYRDVAEAINASEERDRMLDLSRVDIVDPDTSLVSNLSRVIRMDGLGRVRFTNNRINGVLLEDALIFRMSA